VKRSMECFGDWRRLLLEMVAVLEFGREAVLELNWWVSCF